MLIGTGIRASDPNVPLVGSSSKDFFVAPLLLIMCVAPVAKRSSLDPSQFEARLLRRGPCSCPLQDARCGSSVDVQPTENIFYLD